MSSEAREQRIADAATTKRRVAPLFAKRRQAINDDHVEDYDKINDGRKIREITTDGPDGTSKTVDLDVSSILTPGINTTSNLEIITIEAELVADGREVENYHIPANDDVLDRALELLNERDLIPAWEADVDE